MKSGDIIKSDLVKSDFGFLYQKLKKFSCPSGQALQEIDLLNGTSKCTGGSGAGGKCGTAINSCNSGTLKDIADTSSAYL